MLEFNTQVFKFVLLSKCHHTARMFLDDEIVEVNAGVTLATPRDMLLHHYYRGMCLLGLNRVASALACFTLCFSAPAVSLNAIQVEAYKRCLLCSLIMRGEGPTIPKYTAPCVVRHVKTYVPAYTELVSACSKPSIRVRRRLSYLPEEAVL
jgi:COP9 signalosome complex subunit 3